MKFQRLAIGLTVINLVLLVFLLAQMRPLTAQGTAGPHSFAAMTARWSRVRRKSFIRESA